MKDFMFSAILSFCFCILSCFLYSSEEDTRNDLIYTIVNTRDLENKPYKDLTDLEKAIKENLDSKNYLAFNVSEPFLLGRSAEGKGGCSYQICSPFPPIRFIGEGSLRLNESYEYRILIRKGGDWRSRDKVALSKEDVSRMSAFCVKLYTPYAVLSNTGCLKHINSEVLKDFFLIYGNNPPYFKQKIEEVINNLPKDKELFQIWN